MKKFTMISLLTIIALMITSCTSLTLPDTADMTPSNNWQIGNYVDDYGIETGEHYVYSDVQGTFSNSATMNSRASVAVLIDECEVRFKILEYGRYIASGYGLEDIYYVTCNNIKAKAYHGSKYFVVSLGKQDIINELAKGDKVSIRISGGKYSTSTYNFILDGKGFADKYSSLLGL